MQIGEIGKMIYNLRLEKKMSQEDLCRGICSVTTLYRLETGERRPDILVFQALCQRLGKTADYVGIVLMLEEFEYFAKRRNIEISLSLGDYEQAEKELHILEGEEKHANLKQQDIHRQFAILYLLWKQEYQKAKEHVFQALVQTLPDIQEDMPAFREKLLGKLWLSEAEVSLLLMYAYLKEKTGEESQQFMQYIWDYIQLRVTEQETKDKQEAQVRFFLAQIKEKNQQWEECCKDCEAVIETEAKYGSLLLMPEMLSMEMKCLNHGAFHEKQGLRRKQYEILKEIMEEYGVGMEEGLPMFLIQGGVSEKQLLDELIRFSRMRKEFSQEKLSEGVCTPETLSRIETGKRNPTIKHFYGLMQKLGMELGYFNTYFDAERFETLEKGRELRRLIALGRFSEAEEKLYEIEEEIDGNKIKNRQYLAFNHAVLERELYKEDLKENFQRVEQALALTLKKREERFRIYYQPTQIEISLLNQLAVLNRKMGKQREAIEILKSLYDYYHRGKLQGGDRDKRYFMVLGNLASYTEEIGELGQAMEYAKEFIMELLKAGRGNMLGGILVTKAYIQERMGKKICLETYEQAYYICGLFGDLRNQNTMKNYVKKHWEITYEF